MKQNWIKAALLGTCAAAIATAGLAETFNIPGGDLKSALEAYTKATGAALIVSDDLIAGAQTRGVQGALPANDALGAILKGTGFRAQRTPSGAIGIIRGSESSRNELNSEFQLAQATPPPRTAVETVTVTSSKLGGADVQSIPISITALSQEQLTATQTAGGPDLVKQVPNMTFTKTNFTGYSIQIRGIGTQAVSVTTDPAVAVAFNDMPFIRNHFFEQEFYDLGQLEVLRGPQGTLYGRNATAGVVNLTTAKPSGQFEAMASAELGNYHQRRFEGMVNIPIVDDRVDLRVAGQWTKRQGYSFNESTGERIDGRDLWSGRVTLGFKPSETLQAYLVWEHFSEDDDRMRSSKQLCKRAEFPTELQGVQLPEVDGGYYNAVSSLSQGCEAASLYSQASFQVPNGYSLPYFTVLSANTDLATGSDPYASKVQSPNLRVIQSQLDPQYKAKNDIFQLNADYAVAPSLTLTSQTGFNHDFLWATEDYNRFNTSPGVFAFDPYGTGSNVRHQVSQNGVFCDPQLGCSDRLMLEDLSTEHSWQLNQEFRLSSNYSGPLNFSVGGNYLHYETEENYYVFGNSLTLFASEGPIVFGDARLPIWQAGVSDNHECLNGGMQYGQSTGSTAGGAEGCIYVDPNPVGSLNNNGHNYFLSQNPYSVNSYAAFGEGYYNVLPDLKLTLGLRYTIDRKHFVIIPSWLETGGWGYPITGSVDQRWGELTGRFATNWTPKLAFTDQTLIYGSYAHGYKAGGANPPGPVLPVLNPGDVEPVHPLTFRPEFVDAFELGTKNTLLDGSLTANVSLFYYNYEDYQISEIIDRSAVNLNFDAHIKGAEVEASWEPAPGLRFNFAGGYEDARLAKGTRAVDLMDRTAGHADWIAVRPSITQSSNCILPVYVIVNVHNAGVSGNNCGIAYNSDADPVTQRPFEDHPDTSGLIGITGPVTDYPGFNPETAPNGGAGFDKDLNHNALPNAPPFTVSTGAQYTIPLSSDWAATLRGDYYWQADSWWRVFNDLEYDRLHGYSNLNLTLILTSQAGWQVMLYDKNVFNTTAITGAFLNSDDTGLTTNAFLTDPKLIGIRVTKNW